MQTTANPLFVFSQSNRIYSAEDLEFMRRAFSLACDEYPEETETEKQRDMLARAIFSRYERGLSERDLVTVAFWMEH